MLALIKPLLLASKSSLIPYVII